MLALTAARGPLCPRLPTSDASVRLSSTRAQSCWGWRFMSCGPHRSWPHRSARHLARPSPFCRSVCSSRQCAPSGWPARQSRGTCRPRRSSAPGLPIQPESDLSGVLASPGRRRDLGEQCGRAADTDSRRGAHAVRSHSAGGTVPRSPISLRVFAIQSVSASLALTEKTQGQGRRGKRKGTR